ncbi:M23 family metallopeptidase [Candidatus Neomarinimicrobiota bacterium]
MGFLKNSWKKRYQFLLVSEEGGWSRSLFISGHWIISGFIVFSTITALIIGAVMYAVPRINSYNEILEEKVLLHAYRNKVRDVVINSADYGVIGSDLLQELELAVGVNPMAADSASALDDRAGGIRVDDIYMNFLENVPTLAPVYGYVTRGISLNDLDLRTDHTGIDIAAKAGDPVIASASGMVVFSNYTTDMGYLVIIGHGNDYYTIYAHNQVNLVGQRQWVRRGDPIALVGNTGTSMGPHLHFEIWKQSRSVDPRQLIDLYRKQDISVDRYGTRK